MVCVARWYSAVTHTTACFFIGHLTRRIYYFITIAIIILYYSRVSAFVHHRSDVYLHKNQPSYRIFSTWSELKMKIKIYGAQIKLDSFFFGLTSESYIYINSLSGSIIRYWQGLLARKKCSITTLLDARKSQTHTGAFYPGWNDRNFIRAFQTRFRTFQPTSGKAYKACRECLLPQRTKINVSRRHG